MVACNSQKNDDSPAIIVMNLFDVDGLLNTDFNGDDPQAPCVAGQVIVLDSYAYQYVSDILTFTVDDVNKAILAGYTTSNVLDRSNLLVMQYNVTPAGAPGLDTTFGGFNGDPAGVAMGNNPSQGFTLGRQSMGRIIVGGYQNGLEGYIMGLVQAYTSNGLLDQSFGQSGSYLTDSSNAIHASAIDNQDRVVIAYSNGNYELVISRILADGSGVDSSFNTASENAGFYVISYLSDYSCDTSYNIAFDQSGNIFIATVLLTDGPTAIALIQLDSDGNYVTSSVFNASDFGDLSNFTITKLLIIAQAEVPDQSLVLVGYDQINSSQDQIMIASFVQSGEPVEDLYPWVLDTGYFNQADTPGYIKYAVGSQSIQQTAGAIIHPDGRVIVAGSVDTNRPG